MPLCITCSLAGAQTAVSIRQPIVIPAAAISGTAEQVVAAPSPAQGADAALNLNGGHTVIQNTGGLSFTGMPADEMIPARNTAVSRAPETAAAPQARTVQNAEMIKRMRMAVEKIAAEYGNPTFAQIFTNDPIQAQLYRKRLQLVQRMDLARAELEAIEQQKIVTKNEADAMRRELVALQRQAEALSSRIQQARSVLSFAN